MHGPLNVKFLYTFCNLTEIKDVLRNWQTKACRQVLQP